MLTLNSGVGSYETLVGRRSFGAGHTMEVTTRRNNADGTGNHAGEFGFGMEDRTQLLRMYDYNSPYWLFDAAYAPNVSLLALPQSIDTGWHTQRVAFVSAGLVKGQSDNGPWQTISTNIATVSLKPWLFTYAAPGTTTTMDFSSLLVRGYANTDPVLSVSAEQLVPQPQPTTAPANVAAAPGATQVSVSWSAVSENLAIYGQTRHRTRRAVYDGCFQRHHDHVPGYPPDERCHLLLCGGCRQFGRRRPELQRGCRNALRVAAIPDAQPDNRDGRHICAGHTGAEFARANRGRSCHADQQQYVGGDRSRHSHHCGRRDIHDVYGHYQNRDRKRSCDPFRRVCGRYQNGSP